MTALLKARNLYIEYPVLENSHRSLKKTVLNFSTGGKIGHDAKNHATILALDNLNFEIKEGDRVGLLGHNGSGKTTLLRAMAGIYAPTNGSLEIKGRVASLLDVSMGLDQDATGYENIYLRAILDGLTPKTIKQKTNEIAEFSELGDYLHLPVRTYSSGMMMRLSFAISTSVEADILIMDEWLSVGDESFQERASKKLETLVKNAGILVIASHDSSLIDKICNKKIILEHGKIIYSSVINKED
jgi:lipopolysaccharide transport system ATP-binding protein